MHEPPYVTASNEKISSVTSSFRETSGWDDRLDREAGNAFNAVRLVLATLVVLEHSFFLIDNGVRRDPLFLISNGQTNCGHLAVVMFFSLSGFLVTQSLLTSRSVWNFLVKRLARIVPGFLVASALGCLLFGPLAASNVAAYFQSQSWIRIILSALALKQATLTGVLEGNPLHLIHGTLWTIRYEFDCYLVLAMMGVCGLLRPPLIVPTFTVVASCLAMIFLIHMPKFDHGLAALLISSPDWWPEFFPFFFVGSAFYLFRHYIPKSPILSAASLAALSVSCVFGGMYPALLFFGTYLVLYVALSFVVGVSVRGREVDLSYGVYLYGFPIQQLLLFYSNMTLHPVVLFVVSACLSYAFAWVSWVSIEYPCLQVVRSKKF